MTSRNTELPSIGPRIARSQDRWLARSRIFPDTHRAFLARARSRTGSRLRPTLSLLGFSLAGAAAAAVVLFWLFGRPLRFEAHGLSRDQQGQVLVASHSRGTLDFSDGSTVVLDPRAQVSVDALHRDGATVVLHRGSLHATIQHRIRTSWEFRAGPFMVAVVGTGFDLDWNAERNALAVAVQEGAVRVSGCALPDLGVAAGQRATLQCPPGGNAQALALPSAPAPTESAPAAEPPSAVSAHNGVAASAPKLNADTADAAAPAATVEASDAAPADWGALLAQGRLREAYQAADAAGFEAQCDSATATQLLDLAEGALAGGRTDRATSALLRVRKKFAGSASSSSAAYRLGKIAFDRTGSSGDARTWFDVYLREVPSGALAREALGRLLEIEVRTGNAPAARARAEQYLRQYPGGPHAELARKVIAQ
jgi:TolA-binding protein